MMTQAFAIRPTGLTWRQVDDEIVVLDLDSSRYLSLNETGALLWQRIEAGDGDEDRLTQAMVEAFGIDEPTARADVAAFVGDCLGRGLIE